ncbi:hypothetical protein DSL64_03185 [Dyadobacter luteus]|uniref:FecR family protein n=1 Tax=Dyadobacter luteus TaxID=2259619 RepID=A0A3D8YGH6_9BACT|nr:FecR domain-containing protein [Dyadobacter luteus]REA63466.1 hypothetical protein DSL64_03185 [Dyadobacter luteus]
MMTDPKLLRRLVEKYYSNKATPEEILVFIELQRTGVLDEVLDDFLNEQISREADGLTISKPGLLSFSTNIKWAASVSVIIVCAYLIFHFMGSWGITNYVHVHTDQYQEKNIKLIDGSLVTLNRNSEFAYPAEWKGASREVKLISGEAYFQVAQNKKLQAFVVHLPEGFDVKVSGTEFNVKSRGGESRIYLESGAVSIEGNGHETDIKPGQMALCSVDRQYVHISEVDGEAWLAWKNNIFFFDDSPLTEVAEVLRDYYHQKVIIESSEVGQLRFTGKIPRNDMAMVLRILSSTLHIDIVHRNNQIIMEDREDVFPQTD